MLNRFRKQRRGHENGLRDSPRRNALEVNAPKFVRVNGSRLARACAILFERKELGVHFRTSDCIDDQFAAPTRRSTQSRRLITKAVPARVLLQVAGCGAALRERRSVLLLRVASTASERGCKNRFQTTRHDSPLSPHTPAATLVSSRRAGSCTNVARGSRAIFSYVATFPTATKIFTCKPFSSVESSAAVPGLARRSGHINPVV